MSHPEEDLLTELALDARDSQDAAALAEARAHLELCKTCADTVADLRRTRAVLRTANLDPGWTAPAPTVWAGITDALDHLETTGTGIPTTSNERAMPDPSRDGDGVSGSQQRLNDRASGGQEFPTNRPIERGARHTGDGVRRRRLVGWAAGIAAVGLALGLLGGRILWRDSAPAPTTVAQVSLDTLDSESPQELGEASVVRTPSGYELDVRTTRPLESDSGYLEVWLINRDGKRMVSVGVLSGDGPASFPISQRLIEAGYVIVDISHEKFDDDPTHSGDSIVRGQLPV